jgi:tyrosyl-tRNA synthetase
MRQMLAREFVQSRLGENGDGISYAEFSYSLIQGYDFLHLHREYGVSLQVCGSDQWGNSIAGVELIRRLESREAHVWSAPLVINKSTGKKFGKSEAGAVWLDPAKTSPTQFYQFWVTIDDDSVEDYLKIYTQLSQEDIAGLMLQHTADRQQRIAQMRLAKEVTTIVHGEDATTFAELVTGYLVGKSNIGDATEDILAEIRRNIPHCRAGEKSSIDEALVGSTLASSKSEARRLLSEGAISINGQKFTRENFEPQDFKNGRLLIRRGKAFKDSALVELAS